MNNSTNSIFTHERCEHEEVGGPSRHMSRPELESKQARIAALFNAEGEIESYNLICDRSYSRVRLASCSACATSPLNDVDGAELQTVCAVSPGPLSPSYHRDNLRNIPFYATPERPSAGQSTPPSRERRSQRAARSFTFYCLYKLLTLRILLLRDMFPCLFPPLPKLTSMEKRRSRI